MEVGVGGGGGERLYTYGGERLYTYHYTVTTRMTYALRWAAMRAILMFHNCEGQSHKTVSTDHNFWRERRAEADSNRGPSAYQPNSLLLGQTGSLLNVTFPQPRPYRDWPMQIWLKNVCVFCMNFYCFMCDYYVALISVLVLLKCGKTWVTVRV